MKSLESIESKFFSQHGEDGIIEYLVSRLPDNNRTFVEIGCGTGNENNTTHLARQGWGGVVFDRKEARIERYRSLGFESVCAHCIEISPDSIDDIVKLIPLEPAVFSLDIDGYDYHVMKALLERDFRPDIAVLEYNPFFCHLSLTVKYPRVKRLDKNIYYGCGIEAWKSLMSQYGYHYVTTDTTGTNAFFNKGIAPEYLQDVTWIEKIAEEDSNRLLYLPFERV